MCDQSVPPEHRFGRQRLPQHPERRLETGPDHQLHRLRFAIPLFGAQSGRPAEQRSRTRVADESETL